MRDYIIPQKFRRKKFRRKNFGGKNFGRLLGFSAEKISAGKNLAEKISASIFAEIFSCRNFQFSHYPNSFKNNIFGDLEFPVYFVINICRQYFLENRLVGDAFNLQSWVVDLIPTFVDTVYIYVLSSLWSLSPLPQIIHSSNIHTRPQRAHVCTRARVCVCASGFKPRRHLSNTLLEYSWRSDFRGTLVNVVKETYTVHLSIFKRILRKINWNMCKT